MHRSNYILPTVIVACSAPCILLGQAKPTPDTRRDLTPQRQTTEHRPQTELPKIDLPEFVITGWEIIDLPRAEKLPAAETVTGDMPVRTGAPMRENAQILPTASMVRGPELVHSSLSGRISAGIGSFTTPSVAVALSAPLENARTVVDASYARSNGFTPNARWSEGKIGASVGSPVDLTGIGMSGSAASASVAYGVRDFRWYGSTSPSNARSIADGSVSVMAGGSIGGGWTGSTEVGYRGTGVTDSTTTVREGIFSIGMRGDGTLEGIPVFTRLRSHTAGRSGAADNTYGLTTFGGGAQWVPFEAFALTAAVDGYFGSGSAGGSLARVFPTLRVSYALDPRQTLIGAYEPGVVPTTLGSTLENMRYVDAGSEIRHAVNWNSGRIGLESEWTDDIRTRFELEGTTTDDLPHTVDTTGSGVFQAAYGGTSRIVGIKADFVAHFGLNDYFSAAFMMRSSENSASGRPVPYVPEAEMRFSYTTSPIEKLTFRSSLQFVHTRETSLTGSSARLSGYTRIDVRGAYSVTSSIALWAAAANLTNAIYQHWAGYQEPPFQLSLGAAATW